MQKLFSVYLCGVFPLVKIDESESLWRMSDLVLCQVDSSNTAKRPEKLLKTKEDQGKAMKTISVQCHLVHIDVWQLKRLGRQKTFQDLHKFKTDNTFVIFFFKL